MNYAETLQYLYTQVPMFQNKGAGAYKPGLDTTLALSEAFGNPHLKFKTIHVGGTNGKGSTASTLAAVLTTAGYRTGLYTSPHLTDFRERMRIDGQMPPEDFVVDFTACYLADDKLQMLHPTFFELTTVMAFKWFEINRVDIAVVEVGLGGRLDCTNIITPQLSIITNISLDHTALLGVTEPEIAVEKAGIIKPGVPVVIGNAAGQVLDVFQNAAAKQDAPLTLACTMKPFSSAEHTTDGICYHDTEWGDVIGSLTGDCQTENAATALCALSILKNQFPAIDAGAVRDGFANVSGLSGLKGRWMQVAQKPVRVICDTGHNIGGWRLLGPALRRIADGGHTLHMVLGFVNDKDVDAIMRQMPVNARYWFAKPSVERGREAQSTAEAAATCGIIGEVCGSVTEAYNRAMEQAAEGDTVFVGGSTFVVADFLENVVEKDGDESANICE